MNDRSLLADPSAVSVAALVARLTNSREDVTRNESALLTCYLNSSGMIFASPSPHGT